MLKLSKRLAAARRKINDITGMVYAALENRSPERAPRDLWTLPWAENHYPQELKKIREDFPSDFGGVNVRYEKYAETKGDPYQKGIYIDPWGCEFENIFEGSSVR